MKDYLWSVLLFGLSSDRQQLGTGVHQTNSWGCFFSFFFFPIFFRYSSRSTFLSISVSRTQTQLTGKRVLISATSQVQVRSVWAACACPHWLSPPSTAWCYAYVLRPPPPPPPPPPLPSWIRSSSRRDKQSQMPNFQARHRCGICHYRFYRWHYKMFSLWNCQNFTSF